MAFTLKRWCCCARMSSCHVFFLVILLLCNRLAKCAEEQPDDDFAFFMPAAPIQAPEKLQRALVLSGELRAKSVQNPKAVALAVSAAASMLPPVPMERGLRSIKTLPAEAQEFLPAAVDLLASIRELGIAAECLEHPATPHGPPRPLKYLIAANLFDCEAIMPFWTLEVLRLSLLLRNDPFMQRVYFHTNISDTPWKASVSISIYESGSTDNTVTWLRIAEAVWTAAGIPNTVVINGLLTRQTLMDPFSGKFYKQHRIQYLASLRNAAMEPLYTSPPGSYDYVVFINDVFFCAPDVLRLAHFEADIACGLDFEVWIGNKKGRMSGVTQRYTGNARRLLQATGEGQNMTGLDGASADTPLDWRAALEHMSQVHVEEAAKQAAADARVQAARIKPRYEFYDTWVSRDIGGNTYIKTDPIARDIRTVDLLHRGFPIPAKCCWNGMAFINASHIASGLRFRPAMAQEGEFDISECSLFCEDYRRLGSTRVVVDPSVRVSYLVWTKEFHGRLPGGVGAKVPWPVLQRAGALEQLQSLWNETSDCMAMQWIPLRKGAEEADLDKFRVVNLSATNYTHMFLETLRNPAPPRPPSKTCNLIMGPYGGMNEGVAFDDLPITGFGKNRISRILYTNTSSLEGLQVEYGPRSGFHHGGASGNVSVVSFGEGESIVRAVVYYDDTLVYGLTLGTSTGRNVTVGVPNEEASIAWAVPCPGDKAQEGKYRLISFAGTADKKLVRSLTLVYS